MKSLCGTLRIPCWRNIQRWKTGVFQEHGISRELLKNKFEELNLKDLAVVFDQGMESKLIRVEFWRNS